jgi:hypothetical protein
LVLIHYAATLFVSAFILFLVQPMIGKLVLPKLGGTPQVWNTCMVFFQMVLLLGYFYTHAVSTRLKPRQQLILHSIVILLPFIIFVVFPFSYIRYNWVPPLGSNPVLATLVLLFQVVGLPFFVVSTTAPLLQKWFGLSGHPAAKDPYFLYGASNLGSLLSLLVYPSLIEPFTLLNTQAYIWMAGFGLLALLVFLCVGMVWAPSGKHPFAENKLAEAPKVVAGGGELATAIKPAPKSSVPSPSRLGGSAAEEGPTSTVAEVDWPRRLRWIGLAAVPSSLMLGVTYHITTDLSPVPLFWLIPLTLYLLSFILVFARWPVVWTETPHTAMVILQPLGIVMMLLFEMVHTGGAADVWWPITFNVLGFFLTTMVCHGELAKDRPSTAHLTEFYLCMSVGGMLGGMLNGLIAPLVPFVFEFNLAVIAACLLRPTIPFGNFLDTLISGMAEGGPEPVRPAKGRGKPAPVARASAGGPTPGLSYGLDVAVGVGIGVLAFLMIMVSANQMLTFGVPLFLSVVFMFRPLRFGLAIAGIILANELYILNAQSNSVLFRTRSYFGSIVVRRGWETKEGRQGDEYKTLLHGTTDHGRNYAKAESPEKDYSRLATTYYHRKCPVGVVMENYNWFHDKSVTLDTFQSDVRMPAGLVLQGAMGALGTAPMPLGELVECWTEPPYAVIGLGTGTMGSYARLFQHCHFYEIDDQIRKLSLPHSVAGKMPDAGSAAGYFLYLQEAIDRGAHVQVLMGDARQRMALPYQNFYQWGENPTKVPNGGPMGFYHMMVVDAFSSDAIPAHLLTKEAFQMYFQHLTEEGILCVHTSNRHLDLPLVVADIAQNLGLVCKRGHYEPAAADRGATSSEWVMVARKAPRDKGGDYGYLQQLEARRGGRGTTWNVPQVHDGRYLWTDDYYNLLFVLKMFTR